MMAKRKNRIEPYDVWDGTDGYKKPSKIHPSRKRDKKTPLPDPGQSYNPDPEDHQKFLKKLAVKELELQKKQKAINDALKVKVTAQEVQKSDKEELVSGIGHLIGDASTSKGDESSSDTDIAYSDYDEKDFQEMCKDRKVVEKRKSHQQRMRQLKDRLQRKAAKLRKLSRMRLSRFDSIKKLMKKLDAKEKERAKIKKRHKRPKLERMSQKLELSDPIYCLSNELPSNLRQATCPMDKLVREQLESFQSRLLVEPSSYQVKRRKFKKRAFERETQADEK